MTQVAAGTDENGNETAYCIRRNELLSMVKAGEVCYYLYDRHDNVRTLTNEAGRIADSYSYDAYGSLFEKERAHKAPRFPYAERHVRWCERGGFIAPYSISYWRF